jgi:hypothetical protein
VSQLTTSLSYQVTRVRDFGVWPTALLISRLSPMRHRFNQIVGERMPYVTRLIKSPEFVSDECRKHFFPEDVFEDGDENNTG